MGRCLRLFLCLIFSWSFLIWGTHQLQSSQTQVLLQLRKHLEYPNQLDSWANAGIDLCSSSSPQVNITCQENAVTEIRIFGDKHSSPDDYFSGYPTPYKTLSQNFSMDSLITTLTRLNTLRALSLVSLGMWGPIPDKIHRLQSLEYLHLSWNFLYGYVPQTISRLVKLRILQLDGNFLNGTLPDWLDSLSNLTSLSLSNNGFTGQFPSSIQSITSLNDINLSNNEISGEVSDLSRLQRLQWLDFSNNKLDSQLPSLPKQVTVVLLSNNSFTGKIPEEYGKLNQLQQLDLSYNAIQGAFPEKILDLSNIVSVNVSSNVLMGSLDMHNPCGGKLVSVDLSNNRLRGLLPSCLSSKVKNRTVKFGGNCFSNDQEHQNPETYCTEKEHEVIEKKSATKKKNVVILIGVIVGAALLLGILAFGFMALCGRYCPRETSEQHLLHKSVQENSVTGFTSELLTDMRIMSDTAKLISSGMPPYRPFLLDELKAATNNFDKSSVIGEGSNGKMYKGRLENGDFVAIRCLTVSRKYTIRNLKLRLDLLAKLRHTNLVCLLGHCIESEEKYESGANKVYLVYEYVPNGTYQARLSDTSSGKVLKWSDRLNILIGVAKAVHFLHTGVIPGFFSNHLKASNILLTEHWMGKLSDYGLSVVAQESDKEKAEDGLKSWDAKNADDDIYSFGLILLESLIGPAVRARKESFLLNEMVSLTNSDGQRRVMDPLVLASSSQESLSIVVSLTINCISPESSAGPSFEDVLWNLQYAAQVQADSCGDHRTGKTHLSP